MVAISYAVELFEVGQGKLGKGESVPCCTSSGTVDLNLLGAEGRVRDLKEYIKDILGRRLVKVAARSCNGVYCVCQAEQVPGYPCMLCLQRSERPASCDMGCSAGI